MPLEGIVSNGVIVPDPVSDPLPDGTRVQFAPLTGMEPLIRKTPGVCGGSACVGRRRLPVWSLVVVRQLGQPDDALMAQYDPPLTREEVDAAWAYYRRNALEIDREIWWQDTAGNVADGEPVPDDVVIQGLLLGVDDETLRTAFDPPLTDERIAAAWAEYRRKPNRPRPTVSALSAAG